MARDCGHCACIISYETLEVVSECGWHVEKRIQREKAEARVETLEAELAHRCRCKFPDDYGDLNDPIEECRYHEGTKDDHQRVAALEAALRRLSTEPTPGES